jgi:TonB family protein
MRVIRPAVWSAFLGNIAPLHALVLACLISAPANGQSRGVPRASVFTWTALHMVLAPDSTGIYLFASMPNNGGPPRDFQSVLNPAEALDWVSDARWFLDQRISVDDTATARSSPTLSGLENGGRIYFVRRRVGQAWTNDRLLVFEPRDPGISPLMVNTDERTARDILDSLEIVARRSPPFKSGSLLDANGARIVYDKPASVKPGQRPPAYPAGARLENQEGLVIVRFVVGVDGKADMKTARVLASAGEPFQRAVLSALRGFEFEPAKLNGVPVRQIVVMPFDFALIRRTP